METNKMNNMVKVSLFERTEKKYEGIADVITRVHSNIELQLFGSTRQLLDKSVSDRPDLVIFNIGGTEERLRRLLTDLSSDLRFTAIPSIFLISSKTSNEMIDSIIDMGGSIVLKHPIKEEDVYAHIQTTLKRKLKDEQKTRDRDYLEETLLRKVAIQTSRESKFKRVFDQAPMGILLYDEVGQLIDHNDHAFEMLGVTKKDFEGYCDFLKRTAIPDDIRNKLKRRQFVKYYMDLDFDEIRKKKIFGTTRRGKIHLSVRIKPISMGRDRLVYLVYLMDHTRRKEFEDQKKILELAIDQNPDAIVIINRFGKIEYINSQLSDLMGYEPHEIIGKDSHKFRPNGISKEENEKLLQSISDGKLWRGELVNRRKDGTEYIEEAAINPIFNEEGQMTHYVGIFKDITEKRAREQKIRVLSEAMEQSPISVLLTRSDKTIEYVNSQFLKLTDHKIEDVLGKDINCILSLNELIGDQEELEKKLLGGKTWSGEIQKKDKNDECSWRRVTISPIRDGLGKISHFLSTSEDITAKKKVEISYEQERLKAKELAEIKSKFLSNMSHEIRTPLNGIIGLINILINGTPRSDQQEYLELLKFTSDHLLSLINNILDLNKIDEGKLKLEVHDKDLKRMMESLVRTYQLKAQERGITLRLNYQKGLHRYFFYDSTRLTQVISNLLNNALKFTHDGFVKVAIKSLKEVQNISTIRVSIEDSGIGISKAKLGKIFERFSQADVSIASQFGGSGLGLAITKKLLELMGGDIKVSSKIGKGTVFNFDLELKKGVGDDEMEHTTSRSKKRISKKLHVLSVDDNSVNQIITENYVTGWGGVMDKASSGYEALEKITNQSYNIVLMDIQMPGFNGLATTERIRAMRGEYFKNVPIIAVSASAEQNQKILAKKAGMNDYLTKPFYPDELKNIFYKYGKFRLPSNGSENWVNPEKLNGKKDGLTVVEEQLTEYTAGSDEFKVRFIDLLIEEFDDMRTVFEKSIKRKDLEALRSIHHKNKSSLIILKQDKLNDITESAKAFIRGEKKVSAVSLLASFNSHMDELYGFLHHVKVSTQMALQTKETCQV